MEEFNSKQKICCTLSIWTKFMRSVHMDRFHELCPRGHSSCTLSTWIEFILYYNLTNTHGTIYTTKLYYCDNNYYFVIPILFYVY